MSDQSDGGKPEGAGKGHTPYVEGPVVRQKIGRTNVYRQAGERNRTTDDWERDDLINNLVAQLKQCDDDIQERMIGHLTRCDQEYGRRVAEGLGRGVGEVTADAAVSR